MELQEQRHITVGSGNAHFITILKFGILRIPSSIIL